MISEDCIKKKTGFWIDMLQWIQAIVIAAIIAVLIRTFFFEPVLVQGSSMEKTLLNNERLILYKLGYHVGEPKTGDIIVLKYKEGRIGFFSVFERLGIRQGNKYYDQEIDYIKRVIGIPGDVLDISEGKVYINDEPLNEPYINNETFANGMGFPIVIPEHEYFVMGDNRMNSRDSRTIGLIDEERIKGKAVFRYWPLQNLGTIK